MTFLAISSSLLSWIAGFATQASTGAHRCALRLIVEADALGAAIGVDYVGRVTLADGLVRALRLAGAAGDALVVDHQGHFGGSLLQKSTPASRGNTLPRSWAFLHADYSARFRRCQQPEGHQRKWMPLLRWLCRSLIYVVRAAGPRLGLLLHLGCNGADFKGALNGTAAVGNHGDAHRDQPEAA